MKASDLMIGDWVEMNLSPSVHKSYFKAQIVVSNLVSLEANYDFDARPIPLTENILKANGFNDKNELHANDNCFLVYDFANNHLVISYFVSGVNVVYFDMCVMFVHELQHALRMCGLNELADNFKVE